MTRILAICNRKGGCGKTTTAVNLAAEWGARGLRTLLVDLDAQGHAGLGFGVTARRREPAAHMIFTGSSFRLSDAIRTTGIDNVDVVPADRCFDGVSSGPDPFTLSHHLRADGIAERYDVVILDTPPALDPLLVNALAAADAALVPIVPHALSNEGVRQFTRLFFHIASTLKPGLRFLGVVPVMANLRVGHQRHVLEEVATEFGAVRMLRSIRTDIQLAEAFAARTPIRAFAPRCRGAEDYGHMAEDLAHIWGLNTKGSIPKPLVAMGV